MLKRLVEDFEGELFSSPHKKTKKAVEKQDHVFFDSKILNHILLHVDHIGTQLNLLSSCKQLKELKNTIPKQVCDVYQLARDTLMKNPKQELYRLEGLLRNLTIVNTTMFVHHLVKYSEDSYKVNCHSLNAYNYCFKSGLVEVMGFYCYYWGKEFISDVHVKFMTHSGEYVILHQNVHISKEDSHYYLSKVNMGDSEEVIVEIGRDRMFDISHLENLLLSIKVNIAREAFFRIMLGCGGVHSIEECLNSINSCFEYTQDSSTPPKKNKRDRICYFGVKNPSQSSANQKKHYFWSPLIDLDQIINTISSSNTEHTEYLLKYLIELIYKSVRCISRNREKDLDDCLPDIQKKFVAGNCIYYPERKTQRYSISLTSDTGHIFKLILLINTSRFSEEDDECEWYTYCNLVLVDRKKNIYESEGLDGADSDIEFGDSGDEDNEKRVIKALKKNIKSLRKASFEKICDSIMSIVFVKGFQIKYDGKYPYDTKFQTEQWSSYRIVRKKKTLSAPIEAGQIFDDGLDDMEPITIFSFDNELGIGHDYYKAKNVSNPKLDNITAEYVSTLISEFRSIDLDSLIHEKYCSFKDAHATYSEGICDVYDFECKEKNLYFVTGGRELHYCVLVKGFDDIIICGQAKEQIFYWTPHSYYNSEENDDTFELSDIKKLKLKKEVTFEKILDAMQAFLDQFI